MNKYYLECECESEMIRFDFDKEDEDGAYFILGAYRDSFHTESLILLDKIKTWFKRVWFSIQGKEYLLYEVYLKREEILKFKEWINSLDI